jgi:hypothetical protein
MKRYNEIFNYFQVAQLLVRICRYNKEIGSAIENEKLCQIVIFCVPMDPVPVMSILLFNERATNLECFN